MHRYKLGIIVIVCTSLMSISAVAFGDGQLTEEEAKNRAQEFRHKVGWILSDEVSEKTEASRSRTEEDRWDVRISIIRPELAKLRTDFRDDLYQEAFSISVCSSTGRILSASSRDAYPERDKRPTLNFQRPSGEWSVISD